MLDVYSSIKRPVKVNGKIIGTIEDGKFIKTVIGSKHQLKQPPAWAIDADAFDQEVLPNATQIEVVDKENGITYLSSVESFNRLKGELDRGFGRQYFLTLQHWEVSYNGAKQLSLFGGEL